LRNDANKYFLFLKDDMRIVPRAGFAPGSEVLGDDFFALIALNEEVVVRQPESFSQYLPFIEFMRR
jgi:hypothetical protein